MKFASWFKRWFLDGWLTTGSQVACSSDMMKAFTACMVCGRIFPHWLASMTAKEAKARGSIGCQCGGLRIQPRIIPAYQSLYWFCIRGWLIRKVLLRKRLWDPRMPIIWDIGKPSTSVNVGGR